MVPDDGVRRTRRSLRNRKSRSPQLVWADRTGSGRLLKNTFPSIVDVRARRLDYFGMIATVSRLTQTSLSRSSVMRISQTWVVLPI